MDKTGLPTFTGSVFHWLIPRYTATWLLTACLSTCQHITLALCQNYSRPHCYSHPWPAIYSADKRQKLGWEVGLKLAWLVVWATWG